MDRELERLHQQREDNEVRQFEIRRMIRKIQKVAKKPRALAQLKVDLEDVCKEHRKIDNQITSWLIFRAEESLRLITEPPQD